MNIENNGDGNIFNARDISGSTIHVGTAAGAIQPLDIRPSWKVPLQIRPRAFTITGVFSLVFGLSGTVASIYSVMFGTVPPAVLALVMHTFARMGPFPWLVLMVFGLFAAVIGVSLARKRIATLGPAALIVRGDGYVTLVGFEAPCPRCSGILHMCLGHREDPGVHFVCNRNPGRHKFTLDDDEELIDL